MCLIVLAWKAHPRYSLVLATNRDEFFDRPSSPLDYWDDRPDVLGGRDIEKGGSWFATNVDGRWAAVTNFRDGGTAPPSSLSRGHLVAGYVTSPASASTYAAEISQPLSDYPGCNLLFGDGQSLYYASNRHRPGAPTRVIALSPGIYGLSNHLLDTPWPKVEHCKASMRKLLDAGETGLDDQLFELLADRALAADEDLPQTGVAVDRERMLSSTFIVSEGYGTRASTVLLAENDGTVIVQERSFGDGGTELGRRTKTFHRPSGRR
jgi:uncharacterized protein with NRDE domain